MIALQNLLTNKDYTMIDLKCNMSENTPALSSGIHGIIKLESNERYFFINYKMKLRVEFSVTDKLENELLKDFLSRNFYCVAELTGTYKNGNEAKNVMFLHTVFFSEKKDYPDFKIILSDNVKTILEKKGLQIEGFERSFLFTDGYHEHMLAYTNGDYQEELYSDVPSKYKNSDNDGFYDDWDEEEDEDEELSFQNKSKYNNRIKLYGNHEKYGYNIALYVKMSESSENEMILIGDKIVFGGSNIPCLKVTASSLAFTEENEYISHKTKELFENTKDGYLSIWEDYAKLEGKIILDKAKMVGSIRFDKSNIKDNRTVLTVNENYADNISYLNKKDVIWFTDSEPEYIANPEMEWIEYKTLLLTQKKNEKITKNNRYEITSIDYRNRLITIDTTDTIPGSRAVLSISSDLTQIMRRERARELIYNGQSANPKLGLIIEGKTEPGVLSISNSKQKKYPAMTELVMNKIFPDHPPTDNQKEAINIAINTPDIALILGPPGTGKTTVINAIVERLNEIDNQSVCNKGKVLISSTQHDAVINITERMNINGVPTPKFGRKNTEEDDASEMAVTRWCERIKSELAEKYSFIQEIQQRNQLDNFYNIYTMSPSKGSACTFLNFAKKINTMESLVPELELLLQNYTSEENSNEYEDDILKAIRRIRVKKSSFADDGPENLKELFFRLNSINGFEKSHPEILNVIKKSMKTDHEALTKELSCELKKVRDTLLNLYLPKPKYKKEQVDERIIDLYNIMKNSKISATDEEHDIILSLYNELDNNISLVADQLSEYSYAYSSTLQQSVSNKVKKVKLGDTKLGANKIKYDTVIIDEAARAAPGDLLIPLTQAVRRIILVGDPHQLTHIYNEDILNSLGEDNDCSNLEHIQKSMFSYMWEQAKKMEKTDGIKRTIVLNNQYRTHRLLGEFVSNNFYKPSGEEYNSPLDDEFFNQNIYDSPLRWINIPNSFGAMKERHNTYHRECEADYIIKRIVELKNSEKGKKYTYGVITFYRGQANLLKEKMNKIYPDYEHDGIRIGSVDAFQGMEFDVIFLSVVRSGMKSFGFLTSVNRLCVALSRQKKLLVVVGDADMFRSEKAEKEIPSIKHLLERCDMEGWIENYASD